MSIYINLYSASNYKIRQKTLKPKKIVANSFEFSNDFQRWGRYVLMLQQQSRWCKYELHSGLVSLVCWHQILFIVNFKYLWDINEYLFLSGNFSRIFLSLPWSVYSFHNLQYHLNFPFYKYQSLYLRFKSWNESQISLPFAVVRLFMLCDCFRQKHLSFKLLSKFHITLTYTSLPDEANKKWDITTHTFDI